jgi:hypothetical protein
MNATLEHWLITLSVGDYTAGNTPLAKRHHWSIKTLH